MKKRTAALLALLGINQHLSAEQRHDLGQAGLHVTPGGAVAAGSKMAGLALADWVALASLTFIIFQVGYLIWKWRRDYLREEERKARGVPSSSDLGRLEADE
jgi:hypothetical protein